MNQRHVLIFVTLSCVFLSCGAQKKTRPLSRDASLMALDGPDDALITYLKSVDAKTETFFVDQKVSYDEDEGATFKQRYYYNGYYADRANSPVIMRLCGEGECRSLSVIYTAWWLAKEFHAHIVGIEHRYYGQSLPGGSEALDLPALKELTIESALIDLSNVQTKITNDKDLGGPWIVIGGSYPGTLAAYYRAAYPEAVVGAYASSAPMRATPDGFSQYDELSAGSVGETCRFNVLDATGYIHDLAQSRQGLQDVQRMFGYKTEGVRAEDIDSVLVTDVPQFSQYGEESLICDALKKATNAEEKAKILVEKMREFLGDRFYEESLVGVMETNLNTGKRFGERWVYQTCAQAGWHYATSRFPAKSLFPFNLGMDYYRDACRRMYGEGIDDVHTDIVAFMEDQFKDLLPSRVLFTNGSKDPWSTISFVENLSEERDLTAIVGQGSSHCADVAPDVTGPDDPLGDIQMAVIRKIRSWLSNPE